VDVASTTAVLAKAQIPLGSSRFDTLPILGYTSPSFGMGKGRDETYVSLRVRMSRLSAGQHARHGRLITKSATRVQGVDMHCVNWGRHVQLTSSSSSSS